MESDDKAVTLRQLHRSNAEQTTQNKAIGPLTRTVLLTKLPRRGMNRKSIHRGIWVTVQFPCISGPRIKQKIVSGMGYKLPTNQVPNNRIIKREDGLISASFTASSGVFILCQCIINRPVGLAELMRPVVVQGTKATSKCGLRRRPAGNAIETHLRGIDKEIRMLRAVRVREKSGGHPGSLATNRSSRVAAPGQSGVAVVPPFPPQSTHRPFLRMQMATGSARPARGGGGPRGEGTNPRSLTSCPSRAWP